MKKKRAKYRIKSNVRFTMFLTILFLITMFGAGTVFGINDVESMNYPAYQEVQVEHGDTIWNLAKEHCPDYTDIRKLVYQICQINDIQADQLQAGQVLLIPENI